ncbi:TolC family protein [Bremerella sp. T1]|uniref:TolC family protein n=1 Tax=Bremerella sp. TYQ1 TaxID=3119568 RepID=UPI001CCB6685|nr:TolC family protein [Bremerella volcania]UBM35215.1 TolC family protein [Bremerella volcania]
MRIKTNRNRTALRRTAQPSCWIALMLLMSALFVVGCHSPGFYRIQADDEAYMLVTEKNQDPRWHLDRITIEPSPESRMFDPFNPDCPPMPLDDPASNQYMHVVDHKDAYWGWEKDGVTDEVANPNWMAYLPLSEEGDLVLNVDRAVEIARVNSPTYQRELEDLYLSALDVSFERFRFDAQFFGGYEVFYTADGPVRGGGDSSSLLEANTRSIQMEKLFATGGQLVVGFANSMMWEFSGPNTDSVNSLIDFSLVQPLLRGGGRKVVLENLTQQERDLLASVRDMERFNQAFYLDIVAGRGLTSGPPFSGGVPSTGPTGSFGAGGYYGLLQRQQTIRNQESNIASLRSSLAQLEALFEAGRIDSFQVELTRQSLFQTQSSLLSNKTTLANSLDQFKIDMGLPPELNIQLERDPFFDQFNLIDPAFTPVTNKLNDIQITVGNSIIEVLPDPEQLDPNQPEPVLVWDEQVEARLKAVQTLTQQLKVILQLVEEDFFPLVEQDVDRLEAALPSRIEDLGEITDKLAGYSENVQDETVSGGVLSTKRLEELPPQLRDVLSDLKVRFAQHNTILDQINQNVGQLIQNGPSLPSKQLYEEARLAVFDPVPDEITTLISDVLGLSLVQARARAETVTLVPVDISSETALDVARVYRLDWMNAQAAYVDSWRNIQVVANDLMSDLDIVFTGELGNIGDNPVKFNSDNGRLRAGLEWDAPLTRLVERNNYRRAQIQYQRTRRDYYQFRDFISQGLRDTIRTLDLNRINFELRRAAVQVAIAQVERTQLRLQEPAKPNQNNQQFDSSTARDLLNALDSLLSAQNDFLSVGVNYEVLRRGLDIDMGTVQLDERGIWVDPGPIEGSYWEDKLQEMQLDHEIPELSEMSDLDSGVPEDINTPQELGPLEMEGAPPVELPPPAEGLQPAEAQPLMPNLEPPK